MRRLVVVVLSILALAAVPVVTTVPSSAAPALEPSGQPSAKQWRADVRTEMTGSLEFLDRRAARGGRLAVNLDIDNTMLATEYATGRPVGPVLAFARHAHALGMKVFVNTARPRARREETRAELEAAGYVVDRLCLRRPHEPTRHSKPRCRQQFRDGGFRLVANVGNNPTDFAGKDYQRAYRLPNYRGRLT